MTWKIALKEYCKAPLKQTFTQFRWGVVIFFIGMVVIYAASQALTPSLTQELVTLAGLIIIAIGFITAIMAQMRMLISRILNLFD